MNYEECPRCNEKQVVTTVKPDRTIKLAPERNMLQVGDERSQVCKFCHWWSKATWNGQVWQWKLITPLRARESQALNLKLERLKKKRRAFGGKGR